MTLNIILKYLFSPKKIIYKIFLKIKFYYFLNIYNQKKFEKKQDVLFLNNNLNRSEGLKKIEKIKKNLNFSSYDKLSSEHEVLFSCISIYKENKIKNILEIGTFDGVNALILSNLFPKAKIDTIDLNKNDVDFANTYNRNVGIKTFISKRNLNLSNSNSIFFKEMNSLNLLNSRNKYDLIWIDGAHGYPVVCIDIINSLHLINEDGYIICDDVYTNLSNLENDSMYKSIATYEVLTELKKNNLINFNLILKRIDVKSNCIKEERKYIAILKKEKNKKIL